MLLAANDVLVPVAVEVPVPTDALTTAVFCAVVDVPAEAEPVPEPVPPVAGFTTEELVEPNVDSRPRFVPTVYVVVALPADTVGPARVLVDVTVP